MEFAGNPSSKDRCEGQTYSTARVLQRALGEKHSKYCKHRSIIFVCFIYYYYYFLAYLISDCVRVYYSGMNGIITDNTGDGEIFPEISRRNMIV